MSSEFSYCDLNNTYIENRLYLSLLCNFSCGKMQISRTTIEKKYSVLVALQFSIMSPSKYCVLRELCPSGSSCFSALNQGQTLSSHLLKDTMRYQHFTIYKLTQFLERYERFSLLVILDYR